MLDQKYGKVTVENDPGNFREDEPCFIIRGQDIVAVSALLEYRERAARRGASTEFYESVTESVDRFIEFQTRHKDVVKVPD